MELGLLPNLAPSATRFDFRFWISDFRLFDQSKIQNRKSKMAARFSLAARQSADF
jgi:hypothetical protein